MKRTEAEIKAYIDGYNACYKQFKECLKCGAKMDGERKETSDEEK